MSNNPREQMIQLFMQPQTREKAEALTDALLANVAELQLDSIDTQERVIKAYEAGFFDGRHGTPCEQIEAENQLEIAKVKYLGLEESYHELMLDYFIGEDRETEK
jgi:hypothetical protein